MNQKKGNGAGTFVLLVVIAILVIVGFASCGSDHAPGYGNTSKCTICGKPATHHSTNYGFCDKHWQDAINYGN